MAPVDERTLALRTLLLELSHLQGEEGRDEEVLALCERILQRFGDAEEPELLDALRGVLATKTGLLEIARRPEALLSALDEALRLLGRMTSPEATVHWGWAVLNKASTLEGLQRFEEALACYDLLAEKQGGADAREPRAQAASALVHKARLLDRLERTPEALATYDAVVARWGGAPELLPHVAEALLDKGLALARLGRFGDAMESLAATFWRFASANDEAPREWAVRALLSSSLLLFAMNQEGDAVAVVDKARREFSGETGVPLLHALRALADQPLLGEGPGLLQAYVSVFDAVRGALPAPTPRSHAAFVETYRRVTLMLLVQGRERASRRLLEQSLETARVLLTLEPDNPLHLGHASYLCFLTGRQQEAELLARGALQRGARERPMWLLSQGGRELPEGDAFVALVRTL